VHIVITLLKWLFQSRVLFRLGVIDWLDIAKKRTYNVIQLRTEKEF